MFRRPYLTKPFSVLRSSDKRRAQAEFFAAIGHSPPPPAAEGGEATRGLQLRAARLESARAVTFQDCKVTIFIDADGRDPQFVRVDTVPPQYFPTRKGKVYLVAEIPGLLPTLYTFAPVVEKLAQGADLMVPGIRLRDNDAHAFAEGELVCVRCVETDAPAAVGRLLVGDAVLRSERREGGKGVLVLHMLGDELWQSGSCRFPEAEAQVGAHEEPAAEDEKTDADAPADATALAAELQTLSVADADAVFIDAALLAIKKAQPLPPTPLVASLFFSDHVLRQRRVEHQALEVRATSFKKMSRLFKALDKMGVLAVKEKGGELFIMQFSAEHPRVQAVRDAPRTIEKTQRGAAEEERRQTAMVERESARAGMIQLSALYKPNTQRLVALSKSAGWDRARYVTAHEVRTMVADYADAHRLYDARNRTLVRLDEPLREAVRGAKSAKAKAEAAPETMPRPQLFAKIVEACAEFHRIDFPPALARTTVADERSPVIRVGPPQLIACIIELKAGRKLLTRICGLDHYNLDADAVAESLKRLCATSVSSQTASKDSSHKGTELMMQGSHYKAVVKVLEEYGLPESLVTLNDKSKKKK